MAPSSLDKPPAASAFRPFRHDLPVLPLVPAPSQLTPTGLALQSRFLHIGIGILGGQGSIHSPINIIIP